MDLNKALEALKFDQRMKDYYLKHGLVTKEELEAYMKSLEDSANHSEPVTLEDKGDFAD
ncbi:MAG: hypothetical protein HC902_15055 [Calothrix sp. SM1_5_4]|nr:hypothetical protein [Calothrix sp. SM1_5_4]